ncbi:MAG: HD domain-containing protein [Candidatus Dojkabacteria bacterium]|jgi:(p)ppGpp synthase/HD superfamily hydrolase
MINISNSIAEEVASIERKGVVSLNAVVDIKEKAKIFAINAHANQVRKINGEPAVCHPIAVANILGQYNYDDEVISAGYLHDTVEDTNNTIEDIERLFGSRVASLVNLASEPDKSLPWEERKSHTITVVRDNPIDDTVVILADKIQNMEDLTSNLQLYGLSIFNFFKRGVEKKLWYFESVYSAVNSTNSELPIVKRLGESLTKLKLEVERQKKLEEKSLNEDVVNK